MDTLLNHAFTAAIQCGQVDCGSRLVLWPCWWGKVVHRLAGSVSSRLFVKESSSVLRAGTGAFSLQFGTYPQDLEALASAQDPRAREIFRKGLDSPQPLVVVLSVEGLGRLQDAAAIPLIRHCLPFLNALQLKKSCLFDVFYLVIP
jgi:hypothetical protein